MLQGTLINSDICAKRNVVRDSVRACFTETDKSNYEVLLEVSSNKFLVNIVTDTAGAIQGFEIVAVKGFMELSKKVIEVVKKVVSHLREMVD